MATGCPIYCSGHRLDPDEPNHNGKDWPGVRNAGWTAKRQLGHVVNIRTEKNTHRALAVSINSEWSPLLTPEQARQVAGQLLEAADWVEQHKGDPLHGASPAAEVEAHNVKLAAWVEANPR